jgi:hypothetical protein
MNNKRIAFVFTGETRCWDASDVTSVTKNGPWGTNPKNQFSKLAKLFTERTGIHVDFYGYSWDYCKKPSNIDDFSEYRSFDFQDKSWRSPVMVEKARNFSNHNMNKLYGKSYDDDPEWFWNTTAQYWHWANLVLDFSNSTQYDWIIKLRWDLCPTNLNDVITELEGLYNVPVAFYPQPFLMCQKLDVTLDGRGNPDPWDIMQPGFYDMVWAANPVMLQSTIHESESPAELILNNIWTHEHDYTYNFSQMLVNKKYVRAGGVQRFKEGFSKSLWPRVIDYKISDSFTLLSDQDKQLKDTPWIPT